MQNRNVKYNNTRRYHVSNYHFSQLWRHLM